MGGILVFCLFAGFMVVWKSLDKLLMWIAGVSEQEISEQEFPEEFRKQNIEKLSIEKAEEQIKEYVNKDEEIKNQVFTPKTFAQYIGQPKAKSILQTEIKQAKKRNKPLRHIVISGPAGRGKTTLVETIANEADVNMVETITSEIKTTDDIHKLIDKVDGGILFLDEIHSLPRDLAEQFYTMMERFQYNGKPIKPFTMCGATTELGELLQKCRPFYDRFKIPIELEEYSDDELFNIGKQYKDKTFPHDSLSDDIIMKLAKSSRGTPRVMLRLVEATIYFEQDYKTVFENFHIIKYGYTHKDLKVLEYLDMNERGAGLQSICAYLDIPSASYLYDIEPYLLRGGLITRGARGRKISDKGKILMEELQNEK